MVDTTGTDVVSTVSPPVKKIGCRAVCKKLEVNIEKPFPYMSASFPCDVENPYIIIEELSFFTPKKLNRWDMIDLE